MAVLTVLTLAYAAVVVIVLALTLIAILVQLVRINRALGQTRDSLERVAAATGPMEEPLRLMTNAVEAARDEFETAADALKRAEAAAEQLTPQPAAARQ
jgi:hypothetical protein